MTDLAAGEDLGDAPEVGPASGNASDRILDATLRCVSRWGMAKTTLDDIAREAGCGRATVYRLYPGGRDALFDALLRAEVCRLFDRIVQRMANQSSLEDLLVAMITEAGQQLSGHAALQFLLAHEPEAILPHLAFHNLDPLLRLVATVFGPLLAPWLPADDVSTAETAARSAEWVTRIVISYLTSLAADVDLCVEESVRRLVTLFIIPGLLPEAHSVRSVPILAT